MFIYVCIYKVKTFQSSFVNLNIFAPHTASVFFSRCSPVKVCTVAKQIHCILLQQVYKTYKAYSGPLNGSELKPLLNTKNTPRSHKATHWHPCREDSRWWMNFLFLCMEIAELRPPHPPEGVKIKVVAQNKKYFSPSSSQVPGRN